jgi:hypothetical protein
MINIIRIIKLCIYGYSKEGDKYYIACVEHGITLGYMHGFNHNISCLKCVNEEIAEWEESKNIKPK